MASRRSPGSASNTKRITVEQTASTEKNVMAAISKAWLAA